MTAFSTTRALLAPAAALLAAVAALAGCSSGSVASPPTGVDGLVIPTPSLAAADFTGGVTNPWFPLPAGSRRSYVVVDLDGEHRLTVTVRRGPVIDGVATTARVATERGRSTTDWYAQDRRGDVWWFGRAGQWRAGSGHAEAGLAIPAHPRLGDGWATAYVGGAVMQVATVTALDATVSVPAGRYDDVLALQVESPASGDMRDVYLARGVGLVEDDVRRGTYRQLQLARTTG